MKRGLDPELLHAVSEAIEAQLGLHFPPERQTDLERGLHSAAAELGVKEVEDYARELLLAKLTPEHVASLAAHLTTGETYFFRDPAIFDALALHVLPAIVEQRRGRQKRLRIWSAGCCTGEEPYSLAIAVHRALPDLAEWQVTVLGTDLNARFLRKASEGIYGPWSFRGVPEEMRRAWFRPTDDGRFEILPHIRKMVTFACVNLVEDVYPSLAYSTNAMDLIFCRNVLMYFSREQWRKTVGNFHRSLVEDGQLFVSATEASREMFPGFRPEAQTGATIYRKATGVPAASVVVAPPVPEAVIAPLPPTPTPAPSPVRPPFAPRDHAADARQLANEGRLAEALAACDLALGSDKLSPAHHYLRGVILQEQGAFAEAAAALKRAIYLDADFILAHFALGHLQLRLDRHRDAERTFESLRVLLRKTPPEEVLPESEGITAGRLLESLTSMQEVIA